MKTVDISPKLTGMESAASELYVAPLDIPIGQLIGGVAMNSNSFRRGSGNQVFGSDQRGIWLGKADFEDAPFNVNMDGKANLNKLTFKNESGETILDAGGLVSTSVFVPYGFFQNAPFTTTSNLFVDVPGSAVPITFPRETHILITLSCNFTINPNTADEWGGILGLNIDGFDTPDVYVAFTSKNLTDAYQEITVTCAQTSIFTQPVGTHTYKLRLASVTNGKLITINKIDLDILVLGQ